MNKYIMMITYDHVTILYQLYIITWLHEIVMRLCMIALVWHSDTYKQNQYVNIYLRLETFVLVIGNWVKKIYKVDSNYYGWIKLEMLVTAQLLFIWRCNCFHSPLEHGKCSHDDSFYRQIKFYINFPNSLHFFSSAVCIIS